MKNYSPEKSLTLEPRQLVSLKLELSRTIRIAGGRVWITIEGDANDYWLHAGDTLVLAPGLHVVIEADPASSRIDFLPQHAKPAMAAPNLPVNTGMAVPA